MPGLNGTGPEGRGPKTGRELGKCSGKTDAEKLELLGKGQAKRHKSGGGIGRGNRLKTNQKKDQSV